MTIEIPLLIHKNCGGVISSIEYTDGSWWKQCNHCLKLKVHELDYKIVNKEVDL
jgi:hypothetical protein